MNPTDDAPFGPGRRHTAETREKLRAARLGWKHPEYVKAKIRASLTPRILTVEHAERLAAANHLRCSKEVFDTETLETWESATAAATDLGVSVMSVSRAARGIQHTCAGRILRYTVEE